MLAHVRKIRLEWWILLALLVFVRRWWILLALVVFVAQHIARWGRPLAAHYALERIAPNEWRIERLGNRHETWQARDTDADGVVDEFQTPAKGFARPGLRAEPKRWLVICIDGVPLEMARRLWARGHFREFHAPSGVISSFPTDSETAMTEVFHAAPVPGYEHRYFDRARNEVRGGAWATLTGRNLPYIRVLHYEAPGWAKGLAYIVSRKSYRADLKRLRQRFLASNARVFLGHIGTTDPLFHLFTAGEMEALLVESESLVRDLYLDAQGELGVLIFSDHGHTLVPSRAVPLAALLEQRGWRLRNRLEGLRDVVVPSYGLVGFFAVYCHEQSAAKLAEDLAALEGAELVVVRHEASAVMMLDSAGGSATLAWNEDGSRYRYEASRGDPLELLPVFEQLRAAGRLGDDGSASDADLFAATANARYPDGPARIRSWALNHVQNRANILVSLKVGYFHGAGIFQYIVDITSTHGAFDAASTLGFAMSTRPLPPTMRLAELLPREFLEGRPGLKI